MIPENIQLTSGMVVEDRNLASNSKWYSGTVVQADAFYVSIVFPLKSKQPYKYNSWYVHRFYSLAMSTSLALGHMNDT